MEPLDILCQDEHFIAVNKPAGLLVHRSKIDRHETRFAMQTVRDQVGRHVFPVHRLDKPTSGVLLDSRYGRELGVSTRFGIVSVGALQREGQGRTASSASKHRRRVRPWCSPHCWVSLSPAA